MQKAPPASIEEVFIVAGIGALQFDVGFPVARVQARFIGESNSPKPSCDPDKSDWCIIQFVGTVVSISWRTFSQREILWQAIGS